MPKLLQINITANWGSHGKIAEALGRMVMQQGWESYIAFGRWFNPSQSHLYRIGSNWDEYVHGLGSRLLDNHGLMSHHATKKLMSYIKSIHPDIIHLHNIHGYYLNYPLLFRFLAESKIPVVWTLHDCWPFTGHCAHYMYAGCNKWQTHCRHCPLISNYPRSLFADRSYRNFEKKRNSFLSLSNLTLVPVCNWLQAEVKQSFLKDIPIHQIYNGIDISRFSPQEDTKDIRDKFNIPLKNKVVLGLASNWYRKGLDDFISLRDMLGSSYSIVLVGLKDREMKKLPDHIIGIKRTENINDLIKLYSTANVFFNPTWEDNFPTTNLEALACGTPVVTYDTGGSAEAIDRMTGYKIKQGDLTSAARVIKDIATKDKGFFADNCRKRVTENFADIQCYTEYFKLYQHILNL